MGERSGNGPGLDQEPTFGYGESEYQQIDQPIKSQDEALNQSRALLTLWRDLFNSDFVQRSKEAADCPSHGQNAEH
jgi:hypothetical protein